jgi:cellobiose phosphorylase
LWSYAVSGDLPIVLLKIKDIDNVNLVRQMVQAHAYWRLKGLAVDLVIWNEDQAGYRQVLHDQIVGMIAAGIEAHVIDRPGGIFIRPGDQIPLEDRILFESVARAIITDSKGSLMEQVSNTVLKDVSIPKLQPTPSTRLSDLSNRLSQPDHLIHFNGYGGFSADGREYVIIHKDGRHTPAPWVNVLANPLFGTVISENGQSYSWYENAHEYRLTPWNNDPVSDPGGEAFYLRDEETGQYWSPAPRPVPSLESYVIRHGFGYSVFEHYENGIYSELKVYVAIDASIKFSSLKIRNDSGRPRKISATGYVEWILGDIRAKSAMHIVTEIDHGTGAILARNAYNTEFPDNIAFFDVDEIHKTVTGDRREFIGRNRSLKHPAAMGRLHLSGRVGAGLDPCAAIQVPLELEDGQEHEVIFRLGIAGRDAIGASEFIRRFKGATTARHSCDQMCLHWKNTLGAIQIKTPDQSLNILGNGWLMYQTIACRFWARSAYYQSGGAIGFRDQLQDGMALIYTKPHLLREHLLLCAAHQFVEGDVQHWWHPPAGRGVRTKCSDDYLWLPFATHRYVTAIGDTGVLHESAPFIEGRQLNADEDSYYDLPTRSAEQGTLYEHCVRAIKRALRFGVHGLPLIGSCDWNDGMDKVGEHGKGESVWLGFFLYDVLIKFSGIARLYLDNEFALICEREAVQLRKNLNENGWDGEWYRRAYFDDGTPLGSSVNEECKIDSISQSWSILSGAGTPERSRQAMTMLDKHLVRQEDALVQLLDPPFDKSDLNPGYIKGYVPGVRENGGQYTHAAIWAAMAFAKLGDREKAWELLQIINPLNHGRTKEEVDIYKVEPYVIAADVYGEPPHVGRGGWTWYTGSSGWMYRLIMESLLGLRLQVNKLTFSPCLPEDWESFTLEYQFYSTEYIITVIQGGDGAAASVIVDGVQQEEDHILLVNDHRRHVVEIRIGNS